MHDDRLWDHQERLLTLLGRFGEEPGPVLRHAGEDQVDEGQEQDPSPDGYCVGRLLVQVRMLVVLGCPAVTAHGLTPTLSQRLICLYPRPRMSLMASMVLVNSETRPSRRCQREPRT